VPNNLYYSYLHYSIIIFNGSHCQQSILGDRTWNRNSIPTAATRAQPAPSAVKQSAIAGRVCNWGKNVITRNARGKFNFGRLACLASRTPDVPSRPPRRKSFARQSPRNSMLPQTPSSRADRFNAGLAAPTSSVLSIFLLPHSLPIRRSTLPPDAYPIRTGRDS
jgi:hypothetical protein